MMEYRKRIANHSQLCTVSALPGSQYGANEMGIGDSSEPRRESGDSWSLFSVE